MNSFYKTIDLRRSSLSSKGSCDKVCKCLEFSVAKLTRLASRDNKQVTEYMHLEYGEITGGGNMGVSGA